MTVRTYPFSRFEALRLDPFYAHLRANEPLSRVKLPYGEEAWLATRYDDVKLVLGDRRFSRAAAAERDEPRMMPHKPDAGTLNMDPPEHTRLRGFVSRAFGSRRVELLRAGATAIAAELVDAMLEAGPPTDLKTAFGTPLPVRVICETLGVPVADQDKFGVWAEAVVSSTSLTPEQIGEYLGALMEYMYAHVAKRRAEPQDDLISEMIKLRDEKDRLTEHELVDLAAGLLISGHETTTSQIPNFVFALLINPERHRELVARPDLVPQAVEELLRYVPLIAGTVFARYATEDVQVGDTLVRAGEPVVASVPSANRDEDVFPDGERLDFHRSANPHLGFGHGTHFCFGAQLARMELQVAVDVLVRRLPTLRLAVPEEELRWRPGLLVRGLDALPVTW